TAFSSQKRLRSSTRPNWLSNGLELEPDSRALVAGIHVFSSKQNNDVDGRNKSGHDERVFLSEHIMCASVASLEGRWHPSRLSPTWTLKYSETGQADFGWPCILRGPFRGHLRMTDQVQPPFRSQLVRLGP